MRKGQSSIEFVIIIAALLFSFTVFILYVQFSLSDKAKEKKFALVEDIALSVQEEVALAQASSQGYERTFVLPDRVLNLEYNVSIETGSVYVYTFDYSAALALPLGNVSGFVRPGSNYIENINNSVYINRV